MLCLWILATVVVVMERHPLIVVTSFPNEWFAELSNVNVYADRFRNVTRNLNSYFFYFFIIRRHRTVPSRSCYAFEKQFGRGLYNPLIEMKISAEQHKSY